MTNATADLGRILYSVDEAARVLSLSPNSVKRLIAAEAYCAPELDAETAVAFTPEVDEMLRRHLADAEEMDLP